MKRIGRRKNKFMEFLYRINDMIPEIFEEIIRTYNFKYIRKDSLHSVLAKDNYAIILSVDRDYVDINYLKREGTGIIKYWIHPFLMENLDEEDRSVRREGKDLNTKLINYILLYEKVLRTKWQNILTGKMDWVDDCRKATMCVIRELSGVEYDRCKDVFEM